jgi:glycosyltransferase involved in cell wall biosynthesis
MKTLLHLIETTGPGGAETVFIDLVAAFDSDDYRSIPMVTEGGWVHRSLGRRGVASVTSQAKGSFNLQHLRAILRVIRREHVDLIQAHLPGANIYASLAGLIAGIPVVSIFHGSVDLDADARWKRVKFGIVSRGSSSIVVVSEHLRRDLERRTTLTASKMRVIHNGVDLHRFSLGRRDILRAELGLDKDAFLVCSVGNVRAAKGYDVLIEAARRTAREAPHVHFVIAGEGKGDLYRDLLKQRADRGVERWVHFLGFRDDAAEVFSSCDLFLLPSTSEGFSISTIEAMASALPVVATRSGGPEEIVESGVDGLLVEPGSADSIATAVLDLALDESRRRQLSAAATVSVARRFSLGAMVEAYGALYESLLGSSG